MRHTPARWMLAGGILAAVQMIAFVSVAGAMRPGYASERNWISQLSLGPGGWLADLNLATCGLWLLLCAAGLRAELGTAGQGAAALVAWCGVAMAGIAVVPTDPGIGYPPGVPPVHTTVGLIHQAVAVSLGIAGIVAAALLGRCAGVPALGLIVAAVMAVAFVGGSVLVLLDAGGVLPGNPSGLLERIALYAGLCWIGGVSTRLLAGDPRTRPATSRAVPLPGAGRSGSSARR